MMGSMNLREFKEKSGLSLADIASALGITVGHASDIVNGKRNCSLRIAVEVERITKGKVKCRDLLVEDVA